MKTKSAAWYMTWLVAITLIGGCSYETEPMKPSMRLGIGFATEDQTARWQWEQAAGQFTLLEVTTPGSETRVRLTSGDGEALSVSRLPYLRSAPFFVCAESGDDAVAFELELESVYRLGEQAAGIKFYRVPEDSYANRERAHGIRKLCAGMAEREDENAETWAANLSDLDAAGKALSATGEHERALWAQYFAAYFRYFPLYRYSESLESVEPIINAADAWPKSPLKLLALQLKGQASLERDAEDDEARSRQLLKDAIPSFEQAVQLAKAAGNVFEEAWALNSWGTALYYQNKPAESYEKHEQALNLVKDDPETYLENQIRQNMALTLEDQGKVGQALDELNSIRMSLEHSDDSRELVYILNEQGLMYLKLHYLPQAVETLSRGLEVAKAQGNTESIGRISMFLGDAYRQMGQFEKSDQYLQASLEPMQQARYGRGLRAANGFLADNARTNGKFETMRNHRAAQGDYLTTDRQRAYWLIDQANDGLAENNAESAIRFLDEAFTLVKNSEFRHIADLAYLQSCLLKLETEAACASQEVSAAQARVRTLQKPMEALQGRWLWVQYLEGEKRTSEAFDEASLLVADLQRYKSLLPGIMGAWYWESRAEIFGTYMNLALALDPAGDGDDRSSLLAYSRLINSHASADLGHRARNKEADIRFLLQTQSSQDSDAQLAANNQIDRWLMDASGVLPEESEAAPWTQPGALLEALEADDTLLAVYIDDQSIHSWTATRGITRRQSWPKPTSYDTVFNQALDQIRVVNSNSLPRLLDQLGEMLLEPVREQLKPNLYVLSSGTLAGLPMEVLRLDGKSLIESHVVVNLLTAGAAGVANESLQSSSRLFLAGYPTLPGAEPELERIAESFSGAELTFVTGEALNEDAFRSEEFSQADLVHVATHSEINRSYPELSRLQLSPAASGEERYIVPAQMAGQSMQARLVTLSSCQTTGREGFAFDSHLGFITTFLQSGAHSVVASLWPVRDAVTRELMVEFYRSASRGTSIAKALTQAKRKILKSGDRPDIQDWAAFQVYR